MLTLPRWVSRRRGLAWAESQRAWIEAALADIPPGTPLVPNAEIPLYGRSHRIEWQPEAPRTVRLEAAVIRVGGPADMVPGRVERWLKKEAATILDRETREFARKAGVTVAKVGVGDPVSRWGSCSHSGTIRYSWRLILAPDWVRHATVAHEVAHRVHMNHGPAFHQLVEELLGIDPAPARQWLRRNGAALHHFGRA